MASRSATTSPLTYPNLSAYDVCVTVQLLRQRHACSDNDIDIALFIPDLR